MFEIPDWVRKLPPEDRIAWHSRRIARERPVFDFLDTIQSELSERELHNELDEVRCEIDEVERIMTLLMNCLLYTSDAADE